MQKNENVRLRRVLLITLIAALALIYLSELLPGAETVLNVMMPLFAGSALAYVMNIFVEQLEKIILPNAKNALALKVRRTLTILISFIIVILLIALVIYLIIPSVENTVIAFTAALPSLYEKLKQFSIEHRDLMPSLTDYLEKNQFDADKIIRLVTSYLLGGVGTWIGSATSMIASAINVVYSVVMSIFFSLSMLYNKEKLLRNCRRLLAAYVPPKRFPGVMNACRDSNRVFSSFIIGQLIQAGILTVVCIGGMYLFGFPEPVMISIFVGAMSFIPLLGSVLGSVVGILIVLAREPSMALWFTLFILCLWQIVGNVIYPKILGKSMGLPGIWVLAAVLVGGGLFGIFGMIIGVPMVAVVYRILRSKVSEREKSQEESEPAGNEPPLQFSGGSGGIPVSIPMEAAAPDAGLFDGDAVLQPEEVFPDEESPAESADPAGTQENDTEKPSDMTPEEEENEIWFGTEKKRGKKGNKKNK